MGGDAWSSYELPQSNSAQIWQGICGRVATTWVSSKFFAVLADVEESTSAAKKSGGKQKSGCKENLAALLKTDSSQTPGATDWVEWLRLSQGKAKIRISRNIFSNHS